MKAMDVEFRDEAEKKAYYNEPASVGALRFTGWAALLIGGGMAAYALTDSRDPGAGGIFGTGVSGFVGGMLLLAFARLILEVRSARQVLMEIRTAAQQSRSPERKAAGQSA